MKGNSLDFTLSPEKRGFLERNPAPPDEWAAYRCPECGVPLYAGQQLRREELWNDVIGCEVCSRWVAVEQLENWCAACPNCGEEPGEGDQMVVSEGGLVLACDCCCSDTLVELDGCERAEETAA